MESDHNQKELRQQFRQAALEYHEFPTLTEACQFAKSLPDTCIIKVFLTTGEVIKLKKKVDIFEFEQLNLF